MGSVKDLTVLNPPTEEELGGGYFSFSDRYSVFDWGEMPDHIAGKGRALAMMAAHNFMGLEKIGVRSHFIGMGSMEDPMRILEQRLDYRIPSSIMHVQVTRVIPIEGNYGNYDGSQRHYLVPLEIIFRNGFPLGSSTFKKLERLRKEGGDIDGFLETLGLDGAPEPGDLIDRPLYSYTTKLESSDRSLSESEARRISGLTGEKFRGLTSLAGKVNRFITSEAEAGGFIHYDGKIEVMALDDDVVLVDVVGTFDENRFSSGGVQISKEILRQAYKKLQPQFVDAVERAKERAADEGESEWKRFCEVEPSSLPRELVNLVSEIYLSGANRYTGHEIFGNVRPFDALVRDLDEWNETLA